MDGLFGLFLLFVGCVGAFTARRAAFVIIAAVVFFGGKVFEWSVV